MKPVNPIEPDRYIGTVTRVTASYIHVNLPNAALGREHRGTSLGAVGDFVFIDCERSYVLGRIVETRLPDGERLTVEPKVGDTGAVNPIGSVQLLATVDQQSDRLKRGLTHFPRIGDGVFLAEPRLLAQLIRNAVTDVDNLNLRIGRINAADGVDISLPPDKLFGRHCGVFGATGGGKSWTLATLVEQLKATGGKAVVLDPTGEFAGMSCVDAVYTFDVPSPGEQLAHFPYQHMTEDDLFSLFRPSGQSQGPKLREAIRSLKLVKTLAGRVPQGIAIHEGVVVKLERPRKPFLDAVRENAIELHAPGCLFDIQRLAEQVRQECVQLAGEAGHFGRIDNYALAFCETLIARINTLLASQELQCVFSEQGMSLVHELRAFFADDRRDVAVISFKGVRFEHNTREILLNVIGRFLLGEARSGVFRSAPLVVFLDEAHQFLGRSVGDDYASVKLDAFGIIAKEGRKYGLTCVLATQRPRDVPPDVLSQLGTLIVHRLTNDQDRETVERACGDLDRGAAQFVPMLAPGEAIVIGPELPAPVPLLVWHPVSPPDSRGPSFQESWVRRYQRRVAQRE
ncbi:ATP-binding protein [Mesorhizobium amorphae]|uniref:ATP-binding protein n=1 Tax=Mesorhizobium amorphae TaxID=71433 RepID=UPI001184D864|nr:ATP-binding protein [Mesorhizobium amorphae]